MNDGTRYCLDRDDDGHWYVVRADKLPEWEAWVAQTATDLADFSVPDFAREVGGNPSRVTFTNPVISSDALCLAADFASQCQHCIDETTRREALVEAASIITILADKDIGTGFDARLTRWWKVYRGLLQATPPRPTGEEA